MAVEPMKTQRRIGRLAWLLASLACAATLATFALGVYLVIAMGADRGLIWETLYVPLTAAAYAVIGALVAARHPRNPIGWLFLMVGWLYGLRLLFGLYRLFGPALGMSGDVPALADNLWIPSVLLPAMVASLFFPNGRLLSPRWRIILWAAISGLVLNHFVLAYTPEPAPAAAAGPSLLNIASYAAGLLLRVGLLGSIAAFVLRFRRSRGVERLQMKWLAYAFTLMMLFLTLGGLAWSLQPDSAATDLTDLLTNLGTMGIVLAAGIAILRHGLFDIDLLINRTLVYGLLTTAIVLSYVLIVGGLGSLLRAQGNLLLALATTGLIAVAFQPLRERLQWAANRLIYGERDQPFEALSRLGLRLESLPSASMVYAVIVETVAQALKLPYTAIAVRREDRLETVETYGSPGGAVLPYALHYQGEFIGQLLVSPRQEGEHFWPADERLLRNFARQAGAAVHTVELRAALQRSRQRLVSAREEERRRLRSELHDGLGPALASAIWHMESAQELIDKEPLAAERLVEGSIEQSRTALADIRRLVRNLRPPALDELGLVAALTQAARAYPSTTIIFTAPDPLPPLPAAVEVAVYRIVQQALQAAAADGRGAHFLVSMTLNGELALAIHDDKGGFPPATTNEAMYMAMSERATELGGTFAVRPRGSGRLPILDVTLPLAATEPEGRGSRQMARQPAGIPS